MNDSNQRKSQNGSTLVIALVLISVAAVVTMTSMRGSLLQEKMVANQNIKAVSFMAAESGAASFNKWLKDPNTVWNTTTWQNTIPTTAAGNVNIGTQGYYWIDPNDVTWGANSVTLKVRGYAKSDNSGTAIAKTTLQITMTKPGGSNSTINIGLGIISGGNIDIKGNASINGNMFANGNVQISGGNNTLVNGTASAGGSVKMKGVDAGLLNANASSVQVATITDAWLTQMNAQAAVKTCNINLTGDQGGKIYYCAGNATLAGNFSNATIVATGNLTHNGAAQMGGLNKDGTAVTVAIVAKGDINFNGNSNNAALFWSNSNVNFNGSGSLKGGIVAKGDILRNGVFSFEQVGNVDNAQITTTQSGGASRVTLWQEILE